MNIRLLQYVSSLAIATLVSLPILAAASVAFGALGGSREAASAESTPVPFTPPAECLGTGYSDGELLAYRLLSSEDGPLLLDGSEWRNLADEIDEVLALVFASSDDVPPVGVLPQYSQSELLIGLDSPFAQTLDPVIWEGDYLPPIQLGDASLDTLNAQLGLRALKGYAGSSRFLTLCLDPLVNIPAAVSEYGSLANVAWAEANSLVGDGHDIAAKKWQGTWYVVLREASGDCPAGCTSQDLSYFAVSGSAVNEICQGQALENSEANDLKETWGVRWLPIDPTTCSVPFLPVALPATGGHP